MSNLGVTLAQLVKHLSAMQTFKGSSLITGIISGVAGVLGVKSRHFGLPLAQTKRPNLAISLSGWLGRYTNMEYLQRLPETRTITVPSLSGL